MKIVNDSEIQEREEKKVQTIWTAFKSGEIEVFDRYTESKIHCKYVLNSQGYSVFKVPDEQNKYAKIIFTSINIMKKENINDTKFYPINVDALKEEIITRFEKFNIVLVISELYIGPDIP